MYSSIKMSALAILVAFGVTACGSSKKDGDKVEVQQQNVKPSTQSPAVSNHLESSKNNAETTPAQSEKQSVDYSKPVGLEKEIYYLDAQKADKYNWRHFQLNNGRYLNIIEMSDGNKQGQFKGKVGSLDYTIINLPYSTYGYIDGVQWFYNHSPAGYRSHPGFKEDYLVTTEDNGRTRLLKSELQGSATYEGPIVKRGGEYDGTVTLYANFGKTAEESSISGKIESLSAGTIVLEKTNMQWDKARLGEHLTQNDGSKYEADALKYDGKAMLNNMLGSYQGGFGGPKLSDTSGVIDVGYYEAVFGGERK